MANHFSILALRTPLNSMKRQKDRTLKDELPRSVSAQYATGDRWRNNFRKNEEMEPKQKHHPVVDVLVMEGQSNAIKKILGKTNLITHKKVVTIIIYKSPFR